MSSKATPITAAGGVVYSKIKGEVHVLMIYRNEVWDLPKGKHDEGETIEECAVREVAEETGSKPPKIKFPIMDTIHEYEDEWGHFLKTTHWFAMKTKSKQFRPQKSEGIEKVCWIELDRAIELAGFDNLKMVLQKFKQSL